MSLTPDLCYIPQAVVVCVVAVIPLSSPHQRRVNVYVWPIMRNYPRYPHIACTRDRAPVLTSVTC